MQLSLKGKSTQNMGTYFVKCLCLVGGGERPELTLLRGIQVWESLCVDTAAAVGFLESCQ